MNDQKQIMLFGMPRSGTTWVGKLFDSRPDTFYLHEPDSVNLDTQLPLLQPANAVFDNKVKERIEQWLDCKDEKVIASRPFFQKNYLSIDQWLLFLATAYGTKIAARINKNWSFNPIRRQKQPPIVVWKSIESLGRLAYFNQSDNQYSIHIIRHPAGQIASTLRGLKGKNFIEQTSILEDWQLYELLLSHSGETRFSLADVKQMLPEQRLALRWGIVNDFALAQAQQKRSQVLVYEELCRQPLEKLTNVFELLDLDMPQTTLAYIEESTSSNKADYYATQKDPLTAAYSWKDQLNAEQLKNISEIALQFNSAKLYQDEL